MPIVKCPLCGDPVSDTAFRCPHCLQVIKGLLSGPPKEPLAIISTTDHIEGYSIKRYCGFVTAESAFGLGFFKSIAAELSTITGEESQSLGGKFAEAKQSAMEKLCDEARGLGANALIGTRLDIGNVGELVVVMAKGTAVTVAEKP